MTPGPRPSPAPAQGRARARFAPFMRLVRFMRFVPSARFFSIARGPGLTLSLLLALALTAAAPARTRDGAMPDAAVARAAADATNAAAPGTPETPEPAEAAEAASPWPLVVRDDAGLERHFATAPRRIVTMLPSLTEMAWVLGVGPKLVGVDRFSNWPPEIDALPRLGGLEDAQIEAIVALRPDLVLGSNASRALDRLSALGVPVLKLRSETHADVQRTLALIARLLDTPAAGPRAWARIEAELAAAAARVPRRMRGLRYYFEISGGPYAAGSGSFIDQTLKPLGLVNILPASLGPFPKLNPEAVVRAQPQLILGLSREQVALRQRPGWSSLAAVRDDQICGFDTLDYDMLVRPGPRLGEAAALVADCLVRLERLEPRP